MTYEHIYGSILGGWRVDCRYTDRRWKWLGRLLFVGDALTAGSRRTIRGRFAYIAGTSAATSSQVQSALSGTGALPDKLSGDKQ